jgi:hypothetical protein
VTERTRVADAAWGVLVLSAVVGFGEYVGVRAWALSFTHDESLTFIRYVHEPVSSVLLSRETDANNHPLNTLAMKLGGALLGPSEIALRWSSVAAFVVYVVALVVLLRRVQRRSIRVLGLSLAVANPYVLDFFSLARGYGLALALVVVSVLFTVDYVERPRISAALAAVLSAALAVLANFVTITYFLAVLVVIVLPLVVPTRTAERSIALGRLCGVLVLPAVAVAFLAGIPLMRLRSEGELYVGGHNGFWQDTVQSLVSSTLYRRWDVLDIPLVVLVAAMAAGGAVAAAIAIRRRSLPLHATAFILLAVPAIVSVVQHYAFDSLFLIERTALFFVPLFAIWLSLAADALAQHPRFTAGVTAAAVVITIAGCVNLASAANLSYVLDWRYDATTERVITELAGPRNAPQTIDLRVSYLFQPATLFYRETRFRWLPESLHESIDTGSDYYYVIGPDVEKIRERGARVIRVYALSGGVLARTPRPAE